MNCLVLYFLDRLMMVKLCIVIDIVMYYIDGRYDNLLCVFCLMDEEIWMYGDINIIIFYNF